MAPNITILDYAILPFVLAAIYGIAFRYRNRHYPSGHPYRPYFITGLTLKIAGAVFIGMVYEYYYKGGDTMNFFHDARIINSAFEDSPLKWFSLLLHIPNESTLGYYDYINGMYWYQDPSSYSVAALAAFLGLPLGTTYLPIAAIFAALSFTGMWALFRTFARIYPDLVRPVAVAVLFIPSVVVWGSGVFKDTICLFGLGWLTYGIFQMLIQKNFKTGNILLTILSFLMVARVKLYILVAFVPALIIWVLSVYTSRIGNTASRFLVKLIALSMAVAGSLFIMTSLGKNSLGGYSLENIEQTAQTTRDWIQYSSGEEGSAYDLGKINGLEDMLLKFPMAVNVTLFRPYLWESKKLIILASALEAFLFLILTIRALVTVGVKRCWHTISTDPTIQFCLIFAIVFAFAVGISTGNFGTLSRYKIPCLPFYAMSILLIYYKNRPLNKPLLKFFNI
ncbi:hypothetical protein [Niabella drilacis]|uniref:Dolichyl-phosphate-mannose-protein mannosyltransferase n=1 Tax=Niabella drilacis (strain DSM 25811 / CCM 8410 / CCUG 62505 / LMG 26954 / E90) TaxID=1285928 RepID=A0A1G6NT46_NIADE|nr:hypothetical protein [Niabella drilacis]SDC70457.1 hypothetical protein SAMN04487894_103370 [Niabella drilacis]